MNMRALLVAVALSRYAVVSEGFATRATNVDLGNSNGSKQVPQFHHVLAILSMPKNSLDRIANEAILETAMPAGRKLSVVLRSQGREASLALLRRYVGEVYSQLWDIAMEDPAGAEKGLPDVVVYPQNLPNTAHESWIHIQSDLDCVCSHDCVAGWESTEATGRGTRYQDSDGKGGLDAYVASINSDRIARELQPVSSLHCLNWPSVATAESAEEDFHVVFIDDDEDETPNNLGVGNNDASLLGGARIEAGRLFSSVAVGGTFDGLHFGHRKLLSLAVSSVEPVSGKLTVGITVDEMLTRKRYAEFIPSLDERMRGVQEFLFRLAPGMKNNIRLVPISDSFGPPGRSENFDALVLSHETLDTGYQLNQHRIENGMTPLKLLCTRRTEAHGMSSTTLRRLRSEQEEIEREMSKQL